MKKNKRKWEVKNERTSDKKCLKCGATVKVIEDCKYAPGSTIYADCNKHALWKAEVE